jgi:hypothetical protein
MRKINMSDDMQLILPLDMDENIQMEIEISMREDLIPGYDLAVVGEKADGFLIYSDDKIVEILMQNGVESEVDAYEYLENNIQGSYGMHLFVSEEGGIESIFEEHDKNIEILLCDN